jgi:hypothetical protein
VLAASDQQYDIIAVNLVDPSLPGSSNLYTPEFWRLARRHLRPGGVFAQLMWGPGLPGLASGLAQVFPEVGLYPAGYADSLHAIALTDPAPGGPAVHLDRISPAVADALRRFGIRDARAHVAERTQAAFGPTTRDRLRAWAALPGTQAHTDDRPILEYQWSRDGRSGSAFDSVMSRDDGQ